MAVLGGWWTVRVDLLGGGLAGDLWPTPGRTFAVDPGRTLHVPTEAIDDACAGTAAICTGSTSPPRAGPRSSTGTATAAIPGVELDADVVTVGEAVAPAEVFGHTFDPSENWRHRCSAAPDPIDPLKEVGIVPERPLPYWGRGMIPDPYGAAGQRRRSAAGTGPHTPWPWANAPARARPPHTRPGSTHSCTTWTSRSTGAQQQRRSRRRQGGRGFLGGGGAFRLSGATRSR
ncbi:hypothetical protein [Wenjunlia tyrosinilytica]|nr:hypothetical protein [Wenjunlia tyrosinilytica]